MAIDAVSWLIFASAIALIAYGCLHTRSEPQPAGEVAKDALDRAA